MARQPLIGTFGKFRSPNVGGENTEVLTRLANLGSQAQGIAFGIGAEQAKEEGRLAGLQSVEREGGQVKKPELEDPGISIRKRAFNEASVLAHRAAIQTDTKNRLDELQREESLDPANFELRAQAYKEGLISDMPEELAVLIGADVESSIASRKSKLDDQFFKRIERENQATLAEGLETFTDDILNATREGDEQRVGDLSIQLEAMLNQSVDSGILDPVKANEIREGLRERGEEQKALGEVDRIVFNEDLSLEERLNKGVEFLEDLRGRDLKDLDPSQKDSLLRVVGGKVLDLEKQLARENSKRNIETEREVSDLKVAATQGFDSLPNLIERTEKMFKEGKISGNERTSILNSAYSGNRKAAQQAQDFSLVAKKLTGDFPEIVLHQKTIDDYYDKVYAPILEGSEGSQKNAAQAQYISVLKAVPKTIKDEITNNLLSGDAGLVSDTADLINRIDETPGLSDLAVNANQRAFADVLTGLLVTMEPEQAAKIALEQTDPRDTARITQREEQIKSDKMREDYSGWVEDGFEGVFGANFLQDNINQQAVEAEFQQTFESFFKAGMDKDRARDKTIELLQRNWKESQFGFMKHPPEQYYRVGQNVEYIKEQYMSDLVKGTIGLEFTKDNIFLQADERTSREAAQGKPSYRMLVIDNNGEIHAPVMSDAEGRPSNRWMPDPEKEMARQLKESEKKAAEIRGKKDPIKALAEETPTGKLMESVVKGIFGDIK